MRDKKQEDEYSRHRKLVKELSHLIPSVLDSGEYVVTDVIKTSTGGRLRIVIKAKKH